MSQSSRIEHDSFGPLHLPADRYWGAQAQRSVELFRIGFDALVQPEAMAGLNQDTDHEV